MSRIKEIEDQIPKHLSKNVQDRIRKHLLKERNARAKKELTKGDYLEKHLENKRRYDELKSSLLKTKEE